MMTKPDRVWNRAAMQEDVSSLGRGDRALASLLLFHGLVMNGGLHHALESVKPEELLAAVDGYAFFGFDDVAALLRAADSDPVLGTVTDDMEVAANARYAKTVPDDSHLVARFEKVYAELSDQFAPVDEA